MLYYTRSRRSEYYLFSASLIQTKLSTAGKTTSTITSAFRPVVRTSRPVSSFGEPTIACAPTNGFPSGTPNARRVPIRPTLNFRLPFFPLRSGICSPPSPKQLPNILKPRCRMKRIAINRLSECQKW
ncbi:hypothetical protein BC937DRAFT_93796, partial [Endogone sp. FLAS-F59071]